MNDDDFYSPPAKGIFIALAICAVFWIVIGFVVWIYL